MTKGTVLLYRHLKVPISYGHLTMKMWGFSVSSYLIFQSSSVYLCTLIKDEKRDILIFWPPLSSNISEGVAILQQNWATFTSHTKLSKPDILLTV